MFLQYVKSTINIPLLLRAYYLKVIQWWVSENSPHILMQVTIPE